MSHFPRIPHYSRLLPLSRFSSLGCSSHSEGRPITNAVNAAAKRWDNQRHPPATWPHGRGSAGPCERRPRRGTYPQAHPRDCSIHRNVDHPRFTAPMDRRRPTRTGAPAVQFFSQDRLTTATTPRLFSPQAWFAATTPRRSPRLFKAEGKSKKAKGKSRNRATALFLFFLLPFYFCLL